MDIMVEGRAKKTHTPDEVIIRFDFYTNKETYEAAVEEGTKNVKNFIQNILLKMNFKKEDLKTQSLRVYEESKYDYQNQKNIKLGFAYSQNATLKFDYSVDKVAEMISKVSQMVNPPKYFLNFTLKDQEKAKNEVLAEAYLKAKEKAEVIANVAGMNLKGCVKTDFRPFNERVLSNTNLETPAIMARMQETSNIEESIKTSFTPQDIEISEVIYCLWIAE